MKKKTAAEVHTTLFAAVKYDDECPKVLAVFPTLAYGFRAIMMGMEIHINHGNTHIEITKDDDDK